MKKGVGGGNVIFPTERNLKAKAMLRHQSSFFSEDYVTTQKHLAEIAELIRSGDTKKLEIVLKNATVVDMIRDAVDSKNLHSLHHVGRDGNANIAKLFLNRKFNPNFSNPSTGKTMLHFAVESDNLNLVKFLISQSKVEVHLTATHEINFANRKTNLGGNNIMHIAVANENFDMVKQILNSKRTKSLWKKRNNANCTPLELALFLKNARIASELLTNSSKVVNTDLNKDGDPLLHWALKNVDSDFLRSIRFLKTSSLDLKTLNRFGQPVLATLAKQQMIDAMRLLMESATTKSQCLYTKSSSGETALYVGVSYELPRVVEFFLSSEVRTGVATFHNITPLVNQQNETSKGVNIANNDGMTPLMVACLQNKNTEITRLLLTSNADMSKVNKKGYTPLHLLTVKDDLEDVNVQKARLLMERSNASLETTEIEFGFTPAFMAAVNSKYKLLDAYLAEGKAINQLNSQNETLLHVVTIQGNKEMCEKILKWKPKIGQQDSVFGQTVLHIGARNFFTSNQIKLFSRFLETLEKRNFEMKQTVLDLRDEYGQTALHKAVVGRNMEITKILIDAGGSLSIKDDAENTPLLLSVLIDDVTAFSLLQPKSDLYQKNILNQTVLHLAAIQENAEITEKILTHDSSPAFVNSQDLFGRTALHYAAEGAHKSLKVAELLLKAFADAEVFDRQRDSPLGVAKKNPFFNMIDIFMTGGGSSSGSLREALKLQRNDLIGSHIASILEEDYDQGPSGVLRGDIPKSAASGFKSVDVKLTSDAFRPTAEKIYEELMKQTNLDGSSALHLAAAAGNIKMLDTILRPFGDDGLLCKFVSLADRNGNTPLHVAIANYQPKSSTQAEVDYPEVKNILLEKGVPINTPNNKDETCLHFAAANGNARLFIELIQQGASPSLRDNLGHDCLHIACKNGNMNIVAYLLKRGADINTCTYENNSALHVCALYNASEIAELLIEEGIDQLIVNDKNKTAEAIAIEQNHTNFIRSLWQLNSEKKGYIGPKEPITSREVYASSLKHDNIKSKFPSIIQDYPILAEQVLDYYLIPMAKDQTVVDEIKVSIDFELFETANVENNPLLFMVENKRGTLLSHPVTKAYMYRKWVENTAYFYSFTFVLYFLAALSHTMFMVRVRRKLDGYSAETANTNHIGNRWFAITFDSILYAVTSLLCIIGLLTEILTFFLLGLRYIRRRINWVELFFFVFILAILVYYYVTITVYQKESLESFNPSDSAWFWLTLAMFCLWCNVGFHTRQNQYFGIYIVMLNDIIVTFFRLLIPVTFFILAPSLAYYILNTPNNDYFQEPEQTFFRSLNMVIGNFGGDEYQNDRGSWVYALQSFITIFFVIFITIIIMNLITAVAIGDVTATEMNAIQTKLELSANLIIETEFMRRKLFRSSKLTEDPQIFDVEFADSFGLEFILKLVFGSPLLAKTSIIKEIEQRYLVKYDFGLAEPEEETALAGASGTSAQSGFNAREMQNLIERELKRQQNSIVREMAQIIQKDMENLVGITERLSNTQSESNDNIVTKVNEALQALGEDIKKFVPSAEQQKYEAKLASITETSRAKRRVEKVEGQLKDIRDTVSQVERSLGNYKDFFAEMSLDSVVSYRRQNLK